MTYIDIQEMPINDQILLMEELWENLYTEYQNKTSPDWHKEILERRRKTIKENSQEYISIDSLRRSGG
jgi:putative addiction module component (TIGR02574 family)